MFSSASGVLQPLDGVLDMSAYTSDTAPALTALGKTDGKTYGVFIKAAIKGLIWYDPKVHDYSANPPKSMSMCSQTAKIMVAV